MRHTVLCHRSSSGVRRLVHAIARTGFAEDGAQLYDQIRPEYSKEAIEYILSINDVPAAGDEKQLYVEVGAGTGKFTRSFLPFLAQKRLSDANNSTNKYVATDPSAGFRAVLEKDVARGLGGRAIELSVAEGTGACLPIKEDHSVAAVYIAQAWHWMASDAALQEAHRVLKPQRPLVLVWNALDMDLPWIRDLERIIIDKYYVTPPGAQPIPRYITMDWKKAFDTPLSKTLFRELKSWHGGYQRSQVTKKTIIDRVHSISVISNLDAAGRATVAHEVSTLLATHPDTRHLQDGAYPLVYKTEVSYALSR